MVGYLVTVKATQQALLLTLSVYFCLFLTSLPLDFHSEKAQFLRD